MGTIMVLDGFPEKGKKIELPSIAELMAMPIFMTADADFVYKHGTDLQRQLLDSCDLGERKNVSVWSNIQFLNPDTRSIKYSDRWHVDGSQFPNSTDKLKIIISECTARTEFNQNPMTLSFDHEINHEDFDSYLEENARRLNIIPKAIDCGYLYSFTTNNAHRAVAPLYPEFRYMFRICESDLFTPVSGEKGRKKNSIVFEDVGKSRKSIEHFNNAIAIYTG